MAAMSDRAIVSSGGRITLPARLRKRLGIKRGDVVLLKERGRGIVLQPCAVVANDYYSDEQVAEWDRADQLPERESQRLIEAITERK